MLTKEYRAVRPQIPNDLEIVEYPPEVVERWDSIFEITMSQYATGEIQPMSAAEYAAKKGICLE